MMNEVTFVVLTYSRPSRLPIVIKSIHKFVDNPRILIYIDRVQESALPSEASAQGDLISVCEESKSNGLIQDFRVSKSNQGTKASYFACFDWGFTRSDNVVLLEDDMVLIESPSRFIDSSINAFKFDRQVGMAVLFANFNHKLSKDTLQITNWPIMWGVLLNVDKYSHICNFLDEAHIGDVEGVVSRFAERNLKGTLQKMFSDRFRDTWRYKYSKALVSRTAWDTQWQFALWGLQLRTLVPSRSLIGDLGIDEFSVSTTRKKLEPTVCRSLIRNFSGSSFYCSACESYREVENHSLPAILRNNRFVNTLLLRGLV